MADKKAFCDLQFSDAFMFAATMEDEEICRQVLERVLGIPIKKVKVRAEGSNDAEEAPELIRFLRYVKDASVGEASDGLLHRINKRIAEIKQSRGMEVRYMLFSEMLSDERKEGRKEERANLFRLMDLMEDSGDADKIPLIRKDDKLLKEMYEKYHIEV